LLKSINTKKGETMTTQNTANNGEMRCAFCSLPILESDQINWHHPTWRSKGGTEVVPTHQRCHVEHHSKSNHFREWGRKGGRKTASLGLWIFYLRVGNKPPDPLRWIPFGR
jgi:hypothetical protein